MWKNLFVTTALTGILVGAAIAQSGAPAGNTAPPAATQTIPKGDKLAPASGGSAHFISTQQPDQWLASRFKGTNVVGGDGKSIGSVSDVLFDRSGTIKAYIVSVGGFLGIGAKDVALAPQTFQIVTGDKSKGEGDKLKLAMNADDLKQAAAFQPYNPPRPTPAAGGTQSRPLPMNPATQSRSGS
jgi:hypothetical protein